MRALSLKQPWATLLVHGLKSIEIRSWSSPRRGPILIHAAGVPEERDEAWEHLPDNLKEQAQLLGGFVGMGRIVDCVRYDTTESFLDEEEYHLCPEGWFKPTMYGFVFEDVTVVDFYQFPGWMRFFEVPEEVLRDMGMTGIDD